MVYSKSLPAAHIKSFRSVLEAEKISVHWPRKDQCDTCIAYKTKTITVEEYEQHTLRQKAGRAAKELLKNSASNEKLVVTVDLQSVLTCPKVSASQSYYKLKLQVHNFTIYSLNNKDVQLCLAQGGVQGGVTTLYPAQVGHKAQGGVTSNECEWLAPNIRTILQAYLMPRSKQGVKRPPVDTDNLKTAIDDVLQREFSVGKAARNNSVSKTTLLRHLKAHKSLNNEEFLYTSNIKCKQVFSAQEETLLADYTLMASKLHYGLSKEALAKLAYQFGVANNKNMPPKWLEKEKAGNEGRKILISLRKPEATSLSRATSFNKANVSAFFKNLNSCLDRFQFSPDRVYNLDETGNSAVHNPPRVLAKKGQKQIGSLISGEHGVNITMIAAVNAVGNHVPPMLIFPRVLHRAQSDVLINQGGSNEELFFDYMKHFIAHVKPTQENKLLIIIDNHETHISVPVINLAKANRIILLTMPPHTSHRLQPLDRTVFGPYESFYGEACRDWMVNNPGKTISIYDVSEIIGKAFAKAFTITNIVSGFAVTGICPYNENLFGEEEFLSSYVTDRPYYVENVCDQNKEHNIEPEPGPSGIRGNVQSTSSSVVATIVSPEMRTEMEETENRIDEKEIEQGDYVLVKLMGKKNTGYFVAVVDEILEDGYNVTYLLQTHCGG
ncbi:hypothetical protein NQ315_006098 [Exocentrus adspersus]|uniref:DDE-1 domain-containing protein n=1 Tax=Exocentrus adspersus TaxID=1586481 RepID=A0AAV8VEE7_9CUCU|nr:hypothetical protein NQ315_006098 [Exocentrus adspersus]